MKKFLFGAFLLLFAAFATQAQTVAPSTVSLSNGSNLDTVTNTGVKVQGLIVGGYKQAVTVTFTTANISGTQGGTVIPVASNDGVTYVSCGVVYGASTFTVSSTALSGGFNPPVGYLYYGVQWTGTGTMQGTITSRVNARANHP